MDYLTSVLPGIVLEEGRSLTDFLELILYGSVVLGVLHLCYFGISLISWGVLLVFRIMLSCSATVPGCSAVPPVVFRVPVFLVFQHAVVTKDFKFNVPLLIFQ